MGKYKVILYDLDGTLSDPKVGITKSLQYALQEMGIIYCPKC
jgi:phosphoglycolate phosphatase